MPATHRAHAAEIEGDEGGRGIGIAPLGLGIAVDDKLGTLTVVHIAGIGYDTGIAHHTRGQRLSSGSRLAIGKVVHIRGLEQTDSGLRLFGIVGSGGGEEYHVGILRQHYLTGALGNVETKLEHIGVFVRLIL